MDFSDFLIIFSLSDSDREILAFLLVVDVPRRVGGFGLVLVGADGEVCCDIRYLLALGLD